MGVAYIICARRLETERVFILVNIDSVQEIDSILNIDVALSK